MPWDSLLPPLSPPPPKPVDAHPVDHSPPVPRPALRLCHAHPACAMSLGSHVAERPPQKLTGGTPDLNSPEPHCSHVPTMLHKHFGERDLKGTPTKDTPHVDGAQFPITQRVVLMPWSCQRHHQQQPRL